MRDATSCPPADAELSIAALRYAASDMTPAEAEAFEARLGDDQIARDALAEAVRLSAAASGAPVPTPDPLTRKAVTERLYPTWWSRLFPRRPYRGHPAVWVGLGGGIAAMVAFAVASQTPSPQPVQVAGVGRLTSMTATVLSVEPTGEDSTTVVQPAIQVVVEAPTSPKLNPMGMEKRTNDTLDTAAFPMPMMTPMPTATVPVVGPQPKPATDKIAEGPGDQNPMGDPQIGMTNS